jgi:hypothetical protein
MIVTAKYDGKIDEGREARIHKVFDRCGVRLGVHEPLTPEQVARGEFSVAFTDVEWTSNHDGTWTHLRIYLGDDEHDRAKRLASELRACGMVVGIGSDDVEDDVYCDEEDDEEDDEVK